jgi:hypothetical protein
LDAFNVSATDTNTCRVFERVWTEGLGTKVKVLIINRRGRFSTTTRTHLWHNLGVPKPERASEEEIEVWKESLIPLFEGISLYSNEILLFFVWLLLRYFIYHLF